VFPLQPFPAIVIPHLTLSLPPALPAAPRSISTCHIPTQDLVVPIEVDVVLVGFSGDGGYGYTLDSSKLLSMLSSHLQVRKKASGIVSCNGDRKDVG
jgi:hypothetical protein